MVYLKKLETTSEYKANYSFAVNNLMEAYSNMAMPDDVLKYVNLVNLFDRSSNDEKSRAGLYAGKAYLLKGDTTTASKELIAVAAKNTTVIGAEALYTLAQVEYLKKDYKASQKSILDLVKRMESQDYWVAKAYILLADNYIAVKDTFQAKATLQSVLDNYEGNDDVIPTAKSKLEQINKK